MYRCSKKFLSLFLSFIMLICALPISGMVYAETDLVFTKTVSDNLKPYIENGKYYRISTEDGVSSYTEYMMNYNDMIQDIQNQLLNREESITINFATSDKKYQYIYEEDYQLPAAQQVAGKFYNDVIYDVFTSNLSDARLGDYLYNSVTIESYGCYTRLSQYDSPRDGNERYFTFTITISDITYSTTKQEEEYIADFAEKFTKTYLNENSLEYDKVKTIYDFVVRNTTYDYDVFGGKFKKTDDRYRIAHNAYGALCGNLLLNNKDYADFDLTSKSTVTNQKVISSYNQGLSVCEGYSKLFYYLCVYNGIRCHIVDGDYTENSGKNSDAHEWNYVYLDDKTGDGYKWFQVDTTFASQKSFKEIEMNNYDYFLCGTGNRAFGYLNHQQAYENKGPEARPQLYDWYTKETVSSVEDYRIIQQNLTGNFENADYNVIVMRETVYKDNDEPRYSFLSISKDGTALISIDEDGTISYKDVEGFVYNGYESKYTLYVPYVIGDDREYSVENIHVTDCGQYDIKIYGADDSKLTAKFDIIPLDMSDYNDYDATSNIQEYGSYTGNEMIPNVNIVDSYGNVLVNGAILEDSRFGDFDFIITKDGKKSAIKDMGVYRVEITYKGNYTGKYVFDFTVGKIDLSMIDHTYNFEYLPQPIRTKRGISTIADYYEQGARSLKIGDISIMPNVDFSISSTGSMNYGSKGYITLKGMKDSANVEAESTTNLPYEISEKFDISKYNWKDGSGTTHTGLDGFSVGSATYTGSAIKPVKLSNISSILEENIDYTIVSYSNNVNAGYAKINIKGIGGCTGTASLVYLINKADIKTATITPSKSGSKVVWNGKTLVKGTDYTEKITTTSAGYTVQITGINNFGGGKSINVKASAPNPNVNRVKPSAKNNKITLSATSYTYDGKAKKPKAKLVNSSGKTVDGYYYTVSYSNNTKVGTAKVTLKFRNGYAGSMTKNFSIKPKGTSISSLKAGKKAFTVKWKKQATQTTGYEIQYSTDKNFKKNNKTVAVSKTGTTSKTVSKLSAKKKYYVRIRTYKTVSGKKYYSSWSAKKTVTTKK